MDRLLDLKIGHKNVFDFDWTQKKRRNFKVCSKGKEMGVTCMGKCFKVKFRTKRWRTDMKCDAKDMTGEMECDPQGLFPCCSAHGWCGNSEGHCDCPGCKDFRQLGSEIRGCIEGPAVRRKKSACVTDDDWTDVCFCDSNRCNGTERRRFYVASFLGAFVLNKLAVFL